MPARIVGERVVHKILECCIYIIIYHIWKFQLARILQNAINMSMRLLELFNKVAPWEWDEGFIGSVVAHFSIGGHKYYIQFDNKLFDIHNLHMFEFEEDWPTIVDVMFSMRDANQSVGKRGIDITGTGKAFEVFATIKNIMDTFVNTHADTDYIHFEASEPSRMKLYDRFLKSWPSRTEVAGETDQHSGETIMHYLVKV